MFTSSNQLKIDAAYFLLETKNEFVSYITKSFFSGCLEKNEMDKSIVDIDRLRLELLDNFLFSDNTKSLKEIKIKFQEFIKNKKADILLQEKNMDFSLRFENMRNKLRFLFEEAYKKNLVTESNYKILINKSENYYELFTNTVNSNLRSDVETIMLEKNLENYFYDMYSFYKKIVSK